MTLSEQLKTVQDAFRNLHASADMRHDLRPYPASNVIPIWDAAIEAIILLPSIITAVEILENEKHEERCPLCAGKGRFLDMASWYKCPRCEGKGRVKELLKAAQIARVPQPSQKDTQP